MRELPPGHFYALVEDADGQRRPRSEDASRRDHPRSDASRIRWSPSRKDDIAFVYGSKWKQRYFTKVGDDYFPLGAQWDVTHKIWRAYFVRRQHRLVGAALSARQHEAPDRPALRRLPLRELQHRRRKQVTEWNVGCEKCHGPGSEHVAQPGAHEHRQPGARSIRCSANDTCIQCHSQGQPLTNPIDGSYYDWPVGFRVGHQPAAISGSSKSTSSARRRSPTSPTAPRTRTGCRATTSCRA